MKNGYAFVAFTERGLRLARRLSDGLGGSVTYGREKGFSLAGWTEEQFAVREALIFVGATGIAVRAVAPFLRSKVEDPAVLSMDEGGAFIIPLVSGHLGGANALARRISDFCGGTAVITTATDLNGIFAVDLWAKRQGMTVLQPERIKAVSSRLLNGESVGVFCPWPIRGETPGQVRLCREAEHAQVTVSFRPLQGGALQLVPRVLSLGIGCRRGTEQSRMEEAFLRFCEEREILPSAVGGAASIDRKRDEEGMLRFCKAHGWPLSFFSAEELLRVEGSFSASSFVEETVGVDNVCERAAVLASGGMLEEKKYARDGVTFALAMRSPSLDWSW